MTFFVYLIGTRKKIKLTTYVGYTNNIKKRLHLHNSGKGAKFTRGRKWKLLYSEKLHSKSSALKREYKLKKDNNFRKSIREKNK